MHLGKNTLVFKENPSKIRKYTFVLQKSGTHFQMSKIPLAAIRKVSIYSLLSVCKGNFGFGKLLPSTVYVVSLRKQMNKTEKIMHDGDGGGNRTAVVIDHF